MLVITWHLSRRYPSPGGISVKELCYLKEFKIPFKFRSLLTWKWFWWNNRQPGFTYRETRFHVGDYRLLFLRVTINQGLQRSSCCRGAEHTPWALHLHLFSWGQVYLQPMDGYLHLHRDVLPWQPPDTATPSVLCKHELTSSFQCVNKAESLAKERRDCSHSQKIPGVKRHLNECVWLNPWPVRGSGPRLQPWWLPGAAEALPRHRRRNRGAAPIARSFPAPFVPCSRRGWQGGREPR